MKSRLNITIDQKLLRSAKRYANKHRISVSQLVEGFFKRITGPDRKNIIDLIESLPKPRTDFKKDLRNGYHEDQKKKYGF